MGWIIALSVIGLILIIIASVFAFLKFKAKKKTVAKEKKVKKPKEKKQGNLKNKNGKLETKGSYCDTVKKFLYRKEIKLFILVNKVLPSEFIVFPKIGLDTILEPVGSHALFDMVKGKYVDLVIFEKETMRPRAVIDVFDGTIGDEQLDYETPEVVEALKSANLPIVSFKVKTDYTVDEIKQPIMEALKIEDEKNILKENK